MSMRKTPVLLRRPVIAQVSVCNGPACGDSRITVKQSSAIIPVNRQNLVTAWKEHHLYPAVHLCFTGCLGCCDYAPVVAFAHAGGTCLRGLGTSGEVEVDLVAWAQAIAERKTWVQPPVNGDAINLLRFQ